MRQVDLHSNPSTLLVRCPQCFKSYSVDASEIRDSRPRFECISCHGRFWIAYPEVLESPKGVIGFPVEWDAPPSREETSLEKISREDEEMAPTPRPLTFSCPKCEEPYVAGDQECKKCGVIFLKFEESLRQKERAKKEATFSASPEVRERWDSVLEDYENKELHQNFISAAWADRSLDYAAYKYASILEVVPRDELASQALKEVQALMGTRFEYVVEAQKTEAVKWYENFKFIKEVDLPFRKFHWTSFIMLACGVVIGLGMLMPHMRNLIGFGTSVLFFILALRFYFRVI